MSLISVKNFIAPFKSKVGMTTLLVVAITVFLVRVTSGPDDDSDGYAGAETDRTQRNQDMTRSIEDFLASQGTGAPVRRSAGNDDFLGDILKESPTPPPPPKEDRGPKDLRDIKRSLGLE